jgi:hypothetical protein
MPPGDGGGGAQRTEVQVELALAAAQQGGAALSQLTANLRSGFYGAVLEGFPPGSLGEQKFGGVYRVCGEHAGLPRFQGAEARNGRAHMYRYRSGGADRWYVRSKFAPEENACAAQVKPLPGGGVPEHGREGVKWTASSSQLGLPEKDGKNYHVPNQPLKLTALVRTVTPAYAPLRYACLLPPLWSQP